MNIVNFSQIPFQKQLKAKAGFKDNRDYDFKIYELDKDNLWDLEYFKKLETSTVWNGGRFARKLDKNINSNPDGDEHFFVLENKNGDCLAIAQTQEALSDTDNIKYFATCNNIKRTDGTPKLKNLGRILLTFLIQITRQQNKNLMVEEPLSTAVEFYKKSGFNCKMRQYSNLLLKKQEMDEAINKNTSRGQIDIELV